MGAGELESQRPLNPCHADAALSAIRRDRLCQDVQGAQICVKEITGGLCQDVYRAAVWLAGSQMVQNPRKDPKGWYRDYRQLTTHLGLPVTSPAHPPRPGCAGCVEGQVPALAPGSAWSHRG